MQSPIVLETLAEPAGTNVQTQVTINKADRVTVMIADTGLTYEIEDILTISGPGMRTQHMMAAHKKSLYERQD